MKTRTLLTTFLQKILLQRPYRAESTNEWTAASGITSKNPPSCDGLTSWFKYEELIEDWLDLTVLETSRRGPALKNRLFGIAQKYKPLISREALRAEDGVKYSRDKLRPHFVKGAQSVFLWRFCLFEQGDETLKWSAGLANYLCF